MIRNHETSKWFRQLRECYLNQQCLIKSGKYKNNIIRSPKRNHMKEVIQIGPRTLGTIKVKYKYNLSKNVAATVRIKI